MNLRIKKMEERRLEIPSCSLFLVYAVISSFFAGSTSDVILPRSPAEILAGGSWDLLQRSVGVSAMHMQLLHNNKVVIFDRTDTGPSNLSLPSGSCPDDAVYDCSAHSLLYDVVSNTYRPLSLLSDTWCSSGSLDSSGSLIQTGGYGAGIRAVRKITPCFGNDDVFCDWTENNTYLSFRRWYSTNQILPDGRIIIVGGRRAFTYEFYPKNPDKPIFNLGFLAETRDPLEENNLYPFLHLLPNGNLFVFANRRSIMLDFVNHSVVKEFPDIPGGGKRNYPSTGSSVLLPLWLAGETQPTTAEIMICGGAPTGSFLKAAKTIPKVFVEASRTCGRIRVTDPDPRWVMEKMPAPRVMPDMIMLPTGDVVIINGAANGTAGWEDATNAVLNPVLYSPDEPDLTRRFQILAPTRIPRMYHSAALLLPDGRILVGGSNPHRNYNFTARPYPTELSLEAYHPRYLEPRFARVRPSVLTVEMAGKMSYGNGFSVNFVIPAYGVYGGGISVRLIAPSFSTHSTAMNQRLLVLRVRRVVQLSVFAYKADVDGPANANVAPPGYYMLFVVHRGIPSEAVWVKVA
ncbi:PREDICTED: aldehyde oxidase GLOX-like isoform X2 [Tarenaya hassleriana]|uniref:aldehyde oxidase GLOX-like isoform X1 n=1 Tax=Tarenaya hassleriana TaxID=28532 RepID=UPI0008FD92E8|nr:PREDICTED: aldehyde oxidase GLOX-like isoform X1 [Tarenaya hassleriana]XP_010523440.2 PREDICTED: aldehyde oxidase GLOX-like isoform X2 [Tarenaya hassleriana]